MGHFIIRALWGDLKGKELIKFVLLALGFFFLIGAFWPLKTLKDSTFINVVGPLYLPYAKLASVILFFPLVLLYSKVVDHFSKEKIIYWIIGVYGIIGFILVYFLNHPTIGLQNTSCYPGRWIGWAFFLFVESFITLMLSVYWSFINDVTTPESAKKGYGLIIFGTQLGGLLFTILGNILSSNPDNYAKNAPIIALISVSMFFLIAFVVFILKNVVGAEQMSSYEETIKSEFKNDLPEPVKIGFWDGLRVIITHPYVAGIFAVIFFQEVISTLLGFQMSLLIKATYQDPGLVNKFSFNFALAVQLLACLFGLFGTSFFQRRFGIRFCLVTYPILLGVSIVTYMFYPTLSVIFVVMLIAKAFNYALNQPAKETLYIPTSKNIKYKSKAWIDMFGLRFAKASGAAFNGVVGPIVSISGGFALILITVWIFLASLLGVKFKKTIENNEIIE